MEELLAGIWTDKAWGQKQKTVKVCTHSLSISLYNVILKASQYINSVATALHGCSYGVGNKTEVTFVKKLRREDKGKRTAAGPYR